jgi:nucleotide-binding universal stress UspA family protein
MKVLYATDGGRPAIDALALFARLAAPDKTDVTAVTVVGRGWAGGVGDVSLSSEADVVESAVTSLQQAGFAAEKRVLDGQPGRAILNEVNEGGFELVVVGAGNRSRLGRLLMGSVSTKLLHASPVSVMIVRRLLEFGSDVSVLVGADGSEHADRALEQLIALFDPSSCHVHVITVAEHLMPQLSFPIPRAGYATSAPTPEQEQEWIAAAQSSATTAANKLESAGFRTEADAVLGAPAARLLDEADRVHADLVVVGSRGLASVERASLGSVSDQIVREAPATFVGRSV